MKILTTNINKGGTGKTTFTHNFADYLSQHNKVLLMDFDDSANLTGRYGHYEQFENTILSIFEGGKTVPISLTEQLSLIAGSPATEALKERLQTRRQREQLLGKWLAHHYDELSKQYDYLLIDTENDEGILTINALIVSDLIVGIAEPSRDAVLALNQLRSLVNELKEDFHIHPWLFFLANRVNFSENASKEMLEAMQNQSEYLGYIPRRALLSHDETAFRQIKKNQKLFYQQRELINELTILFSQIKQKLDGENDND